MISQNLSSIIECDEEYKHNCDDYETKTHDDLQHKIDNSLLTPFVFTQTNLCLFVTKNDKAIKFNFHEYAHAQMGWFCFKLSVVVSMDDPLVTLEYYKSAVK